MKVSFDFDGTLGTPKIRKYAEDLLERGYDVRVTTSRYDEEHKHLFERNPTNKDMYKITDALGIPRKKIYFTNRDFKGDHIDEDGFIFHIDDDWLEAEFFQVTPCIKCFGNIDWKDQCEKAIREYHLKLLTQMGDYNITKIDTNENK